MGLIRRQYYSGMVIVRTISRKLLSVNELHLFVHFL